MDACEYLQVDAAGLDKAWAPAKKVKFGGGFYCGLVEVNSSEATILCRYSSSHHVVNDLI